MERCGVEEMESKYIESENLRIVKLAEELADKVWEEVICWNGFARGTVGKQLVSSIDSIGANIIEGTSRYSWKEEIHFLYIARGSLKEAKFWLRRAVNRKLIKREKYEIFLEMSNNLQPQLNAFIQKKKENVYQK